MYAKTFSLGIFSFLLLSACSTTVVTDEERALPEEATTEETTPAPKSSGRYSADLSQSYVSFTGKKGDLISHEGKFESFGMLLTKAPEKEDFDGGSLILTIDIGSLATDNDGLTTHLLSEDFFDEATYPQAEFDATSIKKEGGNSYSITGDLQIKDVTKSVTFSVQMTDTYLAFKSGIGRLEFNVGPPAEGLDSIDAYIPIDVKIVFVEN